MLNSTCCLLVSTVSALSHLIHTHMWEIFNHIGIWWRSKNPYGMKGGSQFTASCPIEKVTLWEGFLYLTSGSETDEGVLTPVRYPLGYRFTLYFDNKFAWSLTSKPCTCHHSSKLDFIIKTRSKIKKASSDTSVAILQSHWLIWMMKPMLRMHTKRPLNSLISKLSYKNSTCFVFTNFMSFCRLLINQITFV